MRLAICLITLALLSACGGNQSAPAEKAKPEMMYAEEAVRTAPQPAPATAAPAPQPKAKKGKKSRPPQPPAEPQKEAMDTLEVETDTAVWVLGKTGIITVIIAEPQLLAEGGQPDARDMDIGLDHVPVSAYYLVALDGGQKGQFDILPAPGQQEKQHRAPKGYPATWRYEVTPLKSGQMDLLFTLKIYAEGASAGTSISTRPFHVDVQSRFPKSHWFRLTNWVSHNGGWGPIIGLGAAGLTALAYSEWWRRRRRSRSSKKAATSSE